MSQKVRRELGRIVILLLNAGDNARRAPSKLSPTPIQGGVRGRFGVLAAPPFRYLVDAEIGAVRLPKSNPVHLGNCSYHPTWVPLSDA